MHKQRACISTYSPGLEDCSNTNIVKEHCKDLRTHREEQQISQFDYWSVDPGESMFSCTAKCSKQLLWQKFILEWRALEASYQDHQFWKQSLLISLLAIVVFAFHFLAWIGNSVQVSFQYIRYCVALLLSHGTYHWVFMQFSLHIWVSMQLCLSSNDC